MSKNLTRECSGARRILERADDVLGYPLSRIMHGDDANELNRTVHTQPAVFVHSMALLEVFRELVPLSPIIAAGHSLGEYSALVAAGALDFDEALEIIGVRAKGMEEAQPAGTCGMAAVVGVRREQALGLVESERGDEVLEAANFNAPDQVVVSGHLSAVNRVAAAVKSLKRARAVLLPVSSAFHTSLMEPARESLGRRLGGVTLKDPRFPVVANVDARPYPFPDGGTGLMIDQVVRPVLWEDCVGTMRRAGADLFVEVGPGKVLTGLLRRIDKKARSAGVSDLGGIRSFGGDWS